MDVDRQTFEDLVADALDSIPEVLGRKLENVAVYVEEAPSLAQLAGRRGTLLGLYEGIPLTARSPLGYQGAMPDRITIFKGPICSIARDQEQLEEMVNRTVIHEVAHHFGISDARLDELGWA